MTIVSLALLVHALVSQHIFLDGDVIVYFGSQNITQVNGQGPDRGSQYRSIVFYQNETEKKIIDSKIAELNEMLGEKKVAAQVLPFQKFWRGEDYHQDYYLKNPRRYKFYRWNCGREQRRAIVWGDKANLVH